MAENDGSRDEMMRVVYRIQGMLEGQENRWKHVENSLGTLTAETNGLKAKLELIETNQKLYRAEQEKQAAENEARFTKLQIPVDQFIQYQSRAWGIRIMFGILLSLIGALTAMGWKPIAAKLGVGP